jgi:hypothetical protein
MNIMGYRVKVWVTAWGSIGVLYCNPDLDYISKVEPCTATQIWTLYTIAAIERWWRTG